MRMDVGRGLLLYFGLFDGAGAGVDNLMIDPFIIGINALVATHVHIDHIGHISYLSAASLKGLILCNEPSAILVIESTYGDGRRSRRRHLGRALSEPWPAMVRCRFGSPASVVPTGCSMKASSIASWNPFGVSKPSRGRVKGWKSLSFASLLAVGGRQVCR